MRSPGLLFALALGCGQLLASSPPLVVVKSDRVVGPVGTSLELFNDSSGTATVDQVAASGAFVRSTDAIPRYAVGTDVHWLRFNAFNGSDASKLTMAIPYMLIDELDVFIQGTDHTFTHIASSGFLRGEHKTGQTGHEFIFDLPIAPRNASQVYVRLKGFKPIHAPVMVGTPAMISRSVTSRYPGMGAYAGIMIVLALYNLFVFLSTRDRSYFYYVLSTLAICCTQLSTLGYGPFELLPVAGWLSSRSSLLLMAAAVPLGLQFARHFINTRKYTPRLHKLAPVIYVLLAGICLIYVFGDPWLGYKLGNAMSGLSAMYLLAMCIVAVRRGSRQARFFLLAWTVFLVGVMLFVLRDEGVVPYGTLSVYAMPAGSVVEGILLSLGLADRINVLRAEKERSQAEALRSARENERITRDQNVILEKKVAERTYQLQESLTNLKETQSQLVEAERMSSLGQLTAGIAHEINNPVNFIRSNIAPLKRDMEDLLTMVSAAKKGRTAAEMAQMDKDLGLSETIAEVHEILHSMEEGANRTAEIVQGLRTFSRLDEGDLKMTDLNDGIRSTLSMLTPNFKDEVEVRQIKGDLPMLECLPGKLNQVFMNMINNAMQAAKARHGRLGGLVEVITSATPTEIQVTIRDNGTGMNADTKARIFEPFFTTKPVGEGTGLGLSIAHNIIEKHRGMIEVDSEEGRGTEFRIILPVGEQAVEAKRA